MNEEAKEHATFTNATPLKEFRGTIFITGTGTDVGKTVASAIVVEALEADYWKPVQAGFEDRTDSEMVNSLISNSKTRFFKEKYKLKLPASPHISARGEQTRIDLDKIVAGFKSLSFEKLVVEGAGGLMVPLNEKEFVADLIEKLRARVILVSRNYLGSINHSLLTAAVCKQRNIPVAGWLFNGRYMDYEDEIVAWSGYPKIASIPIVEHLNRDFVTQQARLMRPNLLKYL